MKNIRLLLLLVSLWASSAAASGLQPQPKPKQPKSLDYKYRITFTDKADTPYSLQHPEQYLSERALQRRSRQGIVVDSTDLPVCESYVRRIVELGVKPVARGKWENFLTVACADTTWMAAARALPFVKRIEMVWGKPFCSQDESDNRREELTNQLTDYPDSLYGAATRQILQLQGHRLHEAGYRGEGMMVAVIDAGFHNADRMEALRNAHILGCKDFVNPAGDAYGEGSHGLSVLSCMAMNRPHQMVGAAPEASFWLLRSEDESSEQLVEQDYWAAAVEFADSVGVDVVNTSLGYYNFDNSDWDYAYRHLNGRHALMSRQASRMACKGMVLVCSAGNSGAGSWKKITPPADAFDVLTVGAIDKEGVLASFSSVGNTADGRIKPDVMALGQLTAVMMPDGSQGRANGTSYSSPIICGMVTCLWQALPQLTARQLIELVRQSGNRVEFPDNIYGYGIPDFWKAYQSQKQ